MKMSVCLFSLLLFTSMGYSQQTVALEKSLDSLKNFKATYQKEILEIDKEYSRIDAIIKQKQFNQTLGDIYICDWTTGIYEKPSGLGILGTLSQADTVRVIGQNDNYYNITSFKGTGWVLKKALKTESDYNKQVEEQKERIRAINNGIMEQKTADSVKYIKNQEAERIALAKRKAELINKYGTYDSKRILEKKVWLGMTTDMARESLGEPNDINRTISSSGVNEQWVYGSIPSQIYLYFENGMLITVQD
jgi:hypothetical protein